MANCINCGTRKRRKGTTGLCRKCSGREKIEKYNQNRKMKAQTYRIIEFDGEIKPGVDIPQVFESFIYGSKGILKPPYRIRIHVNEFTGKVVYTECPCDDCKFKRIENCKRFVSKDYKCKHIKFCEGDLIEDKHISELPVTICPLDTDNINNDNTNTITREVIKK